MKRQRFSPRFARLRRGVTFVELMVSIGISSLVLVNIAVLDYYTARSVKEIFGQTRARSARMIALDAIRYRLMNAKIGSCVVSQANRRIEYVDPTKGGVTAALYFVQAQQTLYIDENINDSTNGVRVVSGPYDITFTPQGAGETIQIWVRSISPEAYSVIDQQDGQTTVYLRNK